MKKPLKILSSLTIMTVASLAGTVSTTFLLDMLIKYYYYFEISFNYEYLVFIICVSILASISLYQWTIFMRECKKLVNNTQ